MEFGCSNFLVRRKVYKKITLFAVKILQKLL